MQIGEGTFVICNLGFILRTLSYCSYFKICVSTHQIGTDRVYQVICLYTGGSYFIPEGKQQTRFSWVAPVSTKKFETVFQIIGKKLPCRFVMLKSFFLVFIVSSVKLHDNLVKNGGKLQSCDEMRWQTSHTNLTCQNEEVIRFIELLVNECL